MRFRFESLNDLITLFDAHFPFAFISEELVFININAKTLNETKSLSSIWLQVWFNNKSITVSIVEEHVSLVVSFLKDGILAYIVIIVIIHVG